MLVTALMVRCGISNRRKALISLAWPISSKAFSQSNRISKTGSDVFSFASRSLLAIKVVCYVLFAFSKAVLCFPFSLPFSRNAPTELIAQLSGGTLHATTSDYTADVISDQTRKLPSLLFLNRYNFQSSSNRPWSPTQSKISDVVLKKEVSTFSPIRWDWLLIANCSFPGSLMWWRG